MLASAQQGVLNTHPANRAHPVPHDVRPILLAGDLEHRQVRLRGCSSLRCAANNSRCQ